MNDLLLRVLKGATVPRTPVWMMRQAGRYLPEYRATRAEVGDFMSLCRDPERACEVTLQPLRRFALDAAILFSDILTIPDAMGLGLHFVSGEGPHFQRPLRHERDIRALAVPDIEERLGYVPAAVRLIARELAGRTPLLGFAGSPWTLATYMVEGGPSRDFAQVKTLAYQRPELMQQLLTTLSTAVAAYLAAQVAAGVEAVMIFDTWGGSLPYWAYERFSLDSMRAVIAQLRRQAPDLPIIVFTKGGGQWLEAMKGLDAQAVGLDWTSSLARARQVLGDQYALQGNLDPAILRTSPEVIRREVARVLADYGSGHGHIFNLGHGITPDIPPEHVVAMIAAVQELSPQYHSPS